MVIKIATEIRENVSGKFVFYSEDILQPGTKITAIIVIANKRFKMSTLDSGTITVLDEDSIELHTRSGLTKLMFNEDINELQGELAIKNEASVYFLGVEPAKLPFSEKVRILVNNNSFKGHRLNLTAELIHEPRITRERG